MEPKLLAQLIGKSLKLYQKDILIVLIDLNFNLIKITYN